ncbi:MAG: hypothetical protein IT207_09540 [Fimbriimonadaceae bacterium]|nr:hypothetical protein [Fimbriimonadaceae bacterium]
MRRLREALRFSKPQGLPLEISKQAYLAVLAARQPLPKLFDVVSPQGSDGSVPGFGVPVSPSASAPDRPLERGEYGIASPERKTVLRLKVLSKEEAGFVPSPSALGQIEAQFGKEVAGRVAAAWSLLQLTWESYDPEVYAALDFWLAIAHRLAALTEGIVSDPMAHSYVLPGDRRGRPVGAEVWARELVGIHTSEGHVHTLGLRKFVRPELEVTGIPAESTGAVGSLLLGVAQACLEGTRLSPGDSLEAGEGTVRIAEGGLDRAYWKCQTVLEILPDRPPNWSQFLALWRPKP